MQAVLMAGTVTIGMDSGEMGARNQRASDLWPIGMECGAMAPGIQPESLSRH